MGRVSEHDLIALHFVAHSLALKSQVYIPSLD